VAGRNRVANADHRLRVAARALDAVSPLATLDRGYAIVTDAATGKALTRASEVKEGDDIRTRLAQGELLARITGVFIDKD
jgi:exodeoxyribonuclease VII large subunit